MTTHVALIRDGVEVARLGDVVRLSTKPTNVGGRGFRHLRYRLSTVCGERHAWVFGPLVAVDGHWLPDPTRRGAGLHGRARLDRGGDMSLCIGWAGDCPVHGDFHGCVKGDHRGREHRCECGARVAGFTAGRGSNGRSDRVNLHGSDAAWKRHIRAGEKPCEDCRLAHNEYVRLQKQRRRSA